MEGNILVDGILASCYPSVQHDLAHIGMTLIRWFPQKIEWIFDKENGIQGYVGIAKYFQNWLMPFEQQYNHNNF